MFSITHDVDQRDFAKDVKMAKQLYVARFSDSHLFASFLTKPINHFSILSVKYEYECLEDLYCRSIRRIRIEGVSSIQLRGCSIETGSRDEKFGAEIRKRWMKSRVRGSRSLSVAGLLSDVSVTGNGM